MIFSLALLMTAATMNAQSDMQQRLDSLFTAMAADHRAMCSISISRNGGTIYQHSTGYSVIERDRKIPAQAHTKYRIASITKMFTAAMILQLIQEGRLDYINTLDEYFPQLPGAKQITIGMLLNHRSGLHNILDDPDYPNWKEKAKTQDEILKMISRYPLDFTPDSKASYSNFNYIILGYILEMKTKKSYSEAVNERIISRLGLPDTYYGGKTNPDQNESYSYVYYGDSWVKQPEAHITILAGAGGLLSTPADLTRFIEALYKHELVRSRYVKAMQNINDGFGFGMVPINYEDKVGYGHTGSIDGFNSILAYFPKERLSICFCSNGISIPVNDVLNSVLSIVLEKDDAVGN